MKYLLSILVFFSFSTLAEADNKLDPIIFMLDLSVTEGEKDQAEKFTHEIAKNVLEVEPNTLIYCLPNTLLTWSVGEQLAPVPPRANCTARWLRDFPAQSDSRMAPMAISR